MGRFWTEFIPLGGSILGGIQQTLNLAPSLLRLESTDISLIVGQRPGGATNTVPSGLAAWDATADPFITSISAHNAGTANGGKRGDVLVGYFKVLDESFDGVAIEELYFMIQSGLQAV